MREIKFRAWNRETKKMWWFDVMWGNTWNPGSGWVGMVDIPDGKRIYGKSFNSGDNRIQIDVNDCELMQYTGLKDKNSKEQYEGDIKDFGMYSPEKYGRCLHVIYWDKESAGFYTRELGYKKQEGFPLGEDGEVIGNIYENKELLQKPNQTAQD